jgi:pimeloyl-ACP methyl ester carboxylesterase
MAERTRRRRAVWDSPHQFEEAMRSRPAFARWRPEFIASYTQHGLRRRADGHYELKCSPDVEAQVYEGSLQHNPWPALERLTIPSLLLRATLTESGRVPLLPDAASRIPHCRDVPVAATHFIPMEEPAIVLREMEAFLLRAA